MSYAAKRSPLIALAVALLARGAAIAEEPNYYVASRSYSTRPESEPPPYVRNLGDVDLLLADGPDWLDVGLDYRWRYEYRDDDLRRPRPTIDEPQLTRGRLFLGVRECCDPLRGYVELEDSRRDHSQFPRDTRDVNEWEPIQVVAELYCEDALPDGPLLRVQAGRMAFEYVDRRLIARNAWRNTTNNFQGLRANVGQQRDDWQLDLLAVQPIERLIDDFDRADEEVWFGGAIGDWRRWSHVVTLQPYWLVLDQNGKGPRINRHLHTLGLRGYGSVGASGWDYDEQIVLQVGRQDSQSHLAWAATSELGYTWRAAWKPRTSLFFGYASGDHSPYDDRNQRFERLYGFGRPWSANDYVSWDNLVAPKTRVEFQPHANVRIDAGYGVFWLASRTDLWANVALHDPSGQSGNHMGDEWDIRMRMPLGDRTELTVGYAHFTPGNFPRHLGKGEDSDFFYFELTPRLFE